MPCISVLSVPNQDRRYRLAILDSAPCCIRPRPNVNLVGRPASILHTLPLQWGAKSEHVGQIPSISTTHSDRKGCGERGIFDSDYLIVLLRTETVCAPFPSISFLPFRGCTTDWYLEGDWSRSAACTGHHDFGSSKVVPFTVNQHRLNLLLSTISHPVTGIYRRDALQLMCVRRKIDIIHN
jgi:hypothetical protein